MAEPSGYRMVLSAELSLSRDKRRPTGVTDIAAVCPVCKSPDYVRVWVLGLKQCRKCGNIFR